MWFHAKMMTRQKPARIVLTLAAVICVAVLASSRTFYNEALSDAFFAATLGSIVILHLRVVRKWADLLGVAFGAAAMAFVCFTQLHFPYHLMAWLSFAGLSSFGILAVRLIWEDRDRTLLLCAWFPAILFVASDYFASTMLMWTGAMHPKTLDLYILMFDSSVHAQPAFYVGRIYALHPWIHTASLAAYVFLSVPIAMVYAGRLVRYREKALSAIAAFVIAGPLGIAFYNLFPAAGPRNLLGRAFPFFPPPYQTLVRLILEPVRIIGPRNAMPSLHLAWTLLAFWYSRRLSKIEQSIAFMFLALTAFATLGTGEHWLGDLVVAFPFALMVRALCEYRLPMTDVRRRAAFVFGLGATLSWMLLLRYCTKLFWTSPIVPWSLILGTVALTSIRENLLGRSELESLEGAVPAVERETASPAANTETAPAT
jgi:PAP2 superfamily